MRPLLLLAPIFLAVVPLALSACNADPTQAVVDNAYPAPPEGGDPSGQTVVYKAFWVVTLFSDPVLALEESSAHRVVTATDYAYGILAPHWDPGSGMPPSALIPVRTKAKLFVDHGDVLHITVSDATVDGNCAAGTPLTQDVADLVTQRIFPGDFTGVAYDATSCTTRSLGTDAGADAQGDAGGD